MDTDRVDPKIEDIAKEIYEIMVQASKAKVSVDYIMQHLSYGSSLNEKEKAFNLLISRGVIGWDNTYEYKDTLWIAG